MAEVNEMEKLPEGWKRVRLGDAIEYEQPQKYLVKSEKYDERTGIPVLTAGKSFILGYTEEQFGIYNTIPAIIFDDFTTDSRYVNFPFKLKSSAIKILKTKDNNNDLFFIYNVMQILNFNPGSEHKRYWISEYSKISIPLPPLPEQRKIVESLETVDNAIEKTDRIIEKHKRIKQGLMQDLLTKGIDENGQIRSEETHRFKDSPLGRMPEEWEMVEFYDLFDVIDNRGRTPLFSEEGTIPYLSAENIKNGKILYDFGNFVTDKTYKRYMRGIPTQDHILFTTEAPLGEVAPLPEIKFCFAQRVIAMKPKKGCSKYYLFLIQYELIQRQLNNFVSGTTVKGISAKNLKEVNFIAPPLPEQHRIASILSQIDETIEKEQKYKEKLGRIKQGFMEDLLTGKIRVNHLIDEGVENVSQT